MVFFEGVSDAELAQRSRVGHLDLTIASVKNTRGDEMKIGKR